MHEIPNHIGYNSMRKEAGISGTWPASEERPAKRSPIAGALADLNMAVDNLFKQYNMLEDQLAPVLSVGKVPPTDPRPTAEGSSEIFAAVTHLDTRLVQLSVALHHLQQRVQL